MPLAYLKACFWQTASLAVLFFFSRYSMHAHYTHTDAIPERRTQCTRGVIYYTELMIPRTITASVSNRLKWLLVVYKTHTVPLYDSSPVGCVQLITWTMETRPPVFKDGIPPQWTCTEEQAMYVCVWGSFLGQYSDHFVGKQTSYLISSRVVDMRMGWWLTLG